jgi:hypothetical protein
MQGGRRLIDTVWSRDVVISSTVPGDLRYPFNLPLAGLTLRAPRSVCTLAISALVL